MTARRSLSLTGSLARSGHADDVKDLTRTITLQTTDDPKTLPPGPRFLQSRQVVWLPDHSGQCRPAVEIGKKQRAPKFLHVGRAWQIDAPVRARQSYALDPGATNIEPLPLERRCVLGLPK